MKRWISLTRPQTLPAGISPVIIGLALASLKTTINPLIATLTILSALFLQISSNIINDYYDGIKGSDTKERLGPKRVTAGNELPRKLVKKSFIITLSISFFLGTYLIYTGGLPIFFIGCSSLFFAWAYTGGPFPLSYYALGEVFALIFFGPVALWGTYYLQTLKINLEANVILLGIAAGLIASAIMGINNLRDIVQDKKASKITLASLLGEKRTRLLINIYILTSLAIFSYFTTPFIIFIYFIFSKNWKGILWTSKGRQLNKNLELTGKYLFIISLASSLYMIINNV